MKDILLLYIQMKRILVIVMLHIYDAEKGYFIELLKFTEH